MKEAVDPRLSVVVVQPSSSLLVLLRRFEGGPVADERRRLRAALVAAVDALDIFNTTTHPEEQRIDAEIPRLWRENNSDETCRRIQELDDTRSALAHERWTLQNTISRAEKQYTEWLTREASERNRLMIESSLSLTIVCLGCGLPLDRSGNVFCAESCRRRYEPFTGQWMPQCQTCHRYFRVSATEIQEVAQYARRTWDEKLGFCSTRCLQAAAVDLDDWPALDSPVWLFLEYISKRPPPTPEKRRKLLELQRSTVPVMHALPPKPGLSARLLDVLGEGSELSTSEIFRRFPNTRDIRPTLETLAAEGKIEKRILRAGGRPAVLWRTKNL